jgi:hypothetical protein
LKISILKANVEIESLISLIELSGMTINPNKLLELPFLGIWMLLELTRILVEAEVFLIV